MIEKVVTIQNKLGLHARPASLIVQTAIKFKSEIFLCKGSQVANGRSIMSVMMLAAEFGSQISLQARGEDEAAAIDALAKLIEDKFHET